MAKQLFSPARLEQLMQTPLDGLSREFDLSHLTDSSLTQSALNRAAERALIHTLMQELAILLRPLTGIARDILIHWTRKFELYNLKALIRGKFQGLSFGDIEQNLYDLPPLISLPHDRLLRTENVLELLRQLEQGHYADIARQARQVYEEKNEPFSLDATIDRGYYIGLLRRIRRIEPEERRPLSEMIGTLIDQQNLIWLLRYRFSYRLSPSETYYLLIPFGRQLHQEWLKSLVNLDRFQQVLDELPGRLGEHMQDVRDLLGAERCLEQMSALQARHCLRFSPSAVTRSLAYLVLREMDLKKLYALVQGKVLRLEDGLIRQAVGIQPVALADAGPGEALDV